MKKFLFLISSFAIVPNLVNAACPTPGATVIEVCNDSGGNGIIRAYFFDGTPASSYVLFNLSPPGPVSVPFGPITVNTAIPLPMGAVAGVEFGLVPDSDYIIRVNCDPAGTINIGGFGINVNSANALALATTPDVTLSCNGAANGSGTFTASGGNSPYSFAVDTNTTGGTTSTTATTLSFVNAGAGDRRR